MEPTIGQNEDGTWGWTLGRSGFRTEEQARQNWVLNKGIIKNEGAREQKEHTRKMLYGLLGLDP